MRSLMKGGRERGGRDRGEKEQGEGRGTPASCQTPGHALCL